MAQKSMPLWLSRATEWWSDWGLRVAVVSSVVAHVGLVILARTRRHDVSLSRALFLWPVYQIADVAATFAIGNLSLGNGGKSSPCERQLVAFWAPFLLLHLARPDNISAYALEDNNLSTRQVVEVPLKLLGVLYVVYHYIFLGDNRDLLLAATMMFAVGAFKSIERAFVLGRANLGKIQSVSKERERASERVVSLAVDLKPYETEPALLYAHSMFHFCRSCLVNDASFGVGDNSSGKGNPATGQRIFDLPWRNTLKVVELELSLMYDILYTKAALIHTWGGYLIRLLSPLVTATAASLFWLLPKDCFETADVIITYILLAVAFLLDVVWLLRAFGSTWAYAFLNSRPRSWLHHALLCSGRWRRLRDVVLFLDPSRWLSGRDPRSHRLWSGKIGRYNLLDECTRPQGCCIARLLSWMLSKLGLEHLTCIPKDVKELLFQRIVERLPTHRSLPGNSPKDPYHMRDIIRKWGQEAVLRRMEKFKYQGGAGKDDRLYFGGEFQEDILAWHIATCIFLTHAHQQQLMPEGEGARYTEAIEALSEYLMFLLAERHHMLPGFALNGFFQLCRILLVQIFHAHNKNYSDSMSGREKLANILLINWQHSEAIVPYFFGRRMAPYSVFIAVGVALADVLIDLVHNWDMSSLLELVLDIWVDKLLYAATRCSGESHAKELSHGGELATIVWLMIEHALPFRFIRAAAT